MKFTIDVPDNAIAFGLGMLAGAGAALGASLRPPSIADQVEAALFRDVQNFVRWVK